MLFGVAIFCYTVYRYRYKETTTKEHQVITGTTAREYSIVAGVDARRTIPAGTSAQCRPSENVEGAWLLKVPGYGSKFTFEYPLA